MKTVSYLRISKEGTKDRLGIDAQRTIINHFEKNIEKEFVEIHSGKFMTDRPVLNEAIKYCLDNNCTLVVAKVDRLSRRTEDALAIFEKLSNRLKCCDIPGTLDKFMLTLFAAFADRERELISIRTKQALGALKKIKTLGTPNNLTAEHRASGAQASIEQSLNHPNHRQALSLILSLKKSNSSFSAIADQLNNFSFKTSRGNEWSKPSVAALYNRYERQNATR